MLIRLFEPVQWICRKHPKILGRSGRSADISIMHLLFYHFVNIQSCLVIFGPLFGQLQIWNHLSTNLSHHPIPQFHTIIMCFLVGPSWKNPKIPAIFPHLLRNAWVFSTFFSEVVSLTALFNLACNQQDRYLGVCCPVSCGLRWFVRWVANPKWETFRGKHGVLDQTSCLKFWCPEICEGKHLWES